MKNTKFIPVVISKELDEYLIAPELSHSKIADAYLEISRSMYGLLAQYPSDWRELRKGYPKLIEMLDVIKKKKPPQPGEMRDFERNRIAIKNNKDQASKDINLCISLMLELKRPEIEEKQFKIKKILDILVVAFSGASLGISILALWGIFLLG